MSTSTSMPCSMRVKRRALVKRVAALLGVAALPLPLQASLIHPERWVSAQGDTQNTYGLGWLHSEAAAISSVPTGFRGHGMVQHPLRPGSVVLIARRPGTQAVEVDLASGEVLHGFSCGEDRHLLGHACFSADGSVLFTTEAAIAAGEGRIVLRDTKNYALLDEWPSYGVGPHEIRLMPGGEQLVVANGGILTRPASGRQPLNLDTMHSNLSYLDARTGTLLDAQIVEEPKSSIRHLDVAEDGTVAFAIQVQRAATGHNDRVPLAGVHKPGRALYLFTEPGVLIDRLRDYTGSVAICNHSRLAGYTSPRGSLAVFWSIDDGALAGYHALRDVCGIAATPGRAGFVISNSFGEMRELDGHTLKERREQRSKNAGYRWDNHLLITGAAS